MVRFEHTVLGYDTHPVVEIPSLQIAAGERVVVLGSSGSGKSTLLRAVAGFEAPLEGSLFLQERCVAKAGKVIVPPYERHTGMIFQDLALWPHMNVGENISFGLKMQGIPKLQIKNRLDEMLEMIHLQGYASRSVETLSGGEQQRVALARALITHPKILLMDEPLSSLDETLNEKLCEEIVRLHEKLHFTLLYVTHNTQEARTIATRTLKLVPKPDGSAIHTPKE